MEQREDCVQERLRRGGPLVVYMTFDEDQSLDVHSRRRMIFENAFLFLLNVVSKNTLLRQIETSIALLPDECAPTHAVGSPCLIPDSPPEVFVQKIEPMRELWCEGFMINTSVDPASTSGAGAGGSGFELVIRITRIAK